ncbi:hypothetical protein WG899_14155 [Paucibacter sp. AS339]|uniref:hypothetical protein n=1 Tax=Paucibacter hankyongi TaxID=3133434 RepID=UPI0030AE4117
MNDLHVPHEPQAYAAVLRAASRALFFVPNLRRAVVITDQDGSVHVRGDSCKLEASIGVDLHPRQVPALRERLQQLGVTVFGSESEYAQAQTP